MLLKTTTRMREQRTKSKKERKGIEKQVATCQILREKVGKKWGKLGKN